LKIFLAFLQSEHQHPIPAYSFWQHYIKNGIVEAGYEWTECPDADWALGLVPQSKNDYLNWKQNVWEKTVSWLKKNPADAFLSYLYPEQVSASAIKEIQKLGTPCINFFCDNVREFKKAPAEFEVFNLNWVPEHKAAKWYKASGYAYVNLPMPMWVEPQYRVFKQETNDQVTFIGSKDIQRKLLFENLVRINPDVKLAIYGNGWKEGSAPEIDLVLPGYTFNKKILFNLNFISSQGLPAFLRKIKQRNIDQGNSDMLDSKVNGLLPFDVYNKLTAESMITLGVNRYPSFRYPLLKPGSYSRLRDIEAPMLGACYLTEYTEGMEELYDIGKDIAVYKDDDELAVKIKELEASSNVRKQLKINGQKRALNENSIPSSLNKIMQRLIQ